MLLKFVYLDFKYAFGSLASYRLSTYMIVQTNSIEPGEIHDTWSLLAYGYSRIIHMMGCMGMGAGGGVAPCF